jgi:uncharacterized protein YbbK (DUF523 family)
MSRPILVSACLLGLPTRYDGSARTDARVLAHFEQKDLIPVPVCPEQLAGLPTPRPPCKFAAGDGATLLDGQGALLSADGKDMGEAFRRGAFETLAVARLCKCEAALLKERSPSCGSRFVHRGEDIVPGQGVAAALLRRHGVEVFSEEEIGGQKS